MISDNPIKNCFCGIPKEKINIPCRTYIICVECVITFCDGCIDRCITWVDCHDREYYTCIDCCEQTCNNCDRGYILNTATKCNKCAKIYCSDCSGSSCNECGLSNYIDSMSDTDLQV
jgi:hypothetical protein